MVDSMVNSMGNFSNKIRRIIILFSIFASVFISLNNYAANSSKEKCLNHSAMVDVRYTVDKILSELESNKSKLKKDKGVVYEIIDRVLVPKADFKVMSQLVLTKNWKKLNAKQKKDFIKEFSHLMIRTYGVAFETYDGETVDYLCPIRDLPGKHDRVEVGTIIHSMNRPDSTVKFRILKRNTVCAQCSKSKSDCKTLGGNCKYLKDKVDELTDKQKKNKDKFTQDLKKAVASLDNCKYDYSNCKQAVGECKIDCDKCQECDDAQEKGSNVKVCQDIKILGKGKSKEKYKNSLDINGNICASEYACDNCQFKWLVYDLIIDNISIIDSYRQIFADKFRKQKDANKIITDMHEKNCKDKKFCT